MNLLAAASVLAAVALIGTAATADAHTPTITPSCDGLTVKLTNYESAAVKVWIDGNLLTDVTGKSSFAHDYATDGGGFTYRVSIDDRGTQYDKDTGVVVVQGCPVPTSTVTVSPPPVTTTVTAPPSTVTETLPPVTTTETLPPVTSTVTVPGPTGTTTETGPATTVTSTVPGATVSVEETLPGETRTTSVLGAATEVTKTLPGKTRTVVRDGKESLAFTGMDFGLLGVGVALLGGGVFLLGARRRMGAKH